MKLEEISDFVDRNCNQVLLAPEDIGLLFDYAALVPSCSYIIDIGTAGGSSALVMAMASPKCANIITIDPNKNDVFIRILENNPDLKKKVTFMNMTSYEAAEQFNRNAELIFVDGNHTTPGVVMDIESWCPKLNPNGYIIFHDYFYRTDVADAVHYGLEKHYFVEDKIIESHYQELLIGCFVGRKL